MGVSYHPRHALNCSQFLRRALRVTPGDDNPRRRDLRDEFSAPLRAPANPPLQLRCRYSARPRQRRRVRQTASSPPASSSRRSAAASASVARQPKFSIEKVAMGLGVFPQVERMNYSSEPRTFTFSGGRNRKEEKKSTTFTTEDTEEAPRAQRKPKAHRTLRQGTQGGETQRTQRKRGETEKMKPRR